MASVFPAFATTAPAASRVPHDIWSEIFEITFLTSLRRLQTVRHPPAKVGYTLSLVCKAWKCRAERLPLLWRTIWVFPFELREAGAPSLLKYQVKQARRFADLDVHISYISQHAVDANPAFIRKRVKASLAELASPQWIQKLRSLHVTTYVPLQMEVLLSHFRNGYFKRLDTLCLNLQSSTDHILSPDVLRGAHFSALRSVQLVSVVIGGLCLRNNLPTILDVTIGAESARHSMQPFWDLAQTAGTSMLTSHFNIAHCDKMLLPGICERRDNLSVAELSINAGCAKILLASGSFQNVTSASFTDIPDLKEFMGVLFWGWKADPSSTWRPHDGRALLPSLQSLHLDLCTSRRTFAESWRKLFRLTKHVMHFALESKFPAARSGAPKSMLLTMHLAAGGVKMWRSLTRITIRDRPDVMLESCLGAVLDIFAGEGWAITFDLDDRTREYMTKKCERMNERLRKITETFEQRLL